MNFYSHHASSEINVNGGANYVIRSALLLACSMAGENTNPLIIYIRIDQGDKVLRQASFFENPYLLYLQYAEAKMTGSKAAYKSLTRPVPFHDFTLFLSSLFSRVVLPTQAEIFYCVGETGREKREDNK